MADFDPSPIGFRPNIGRESFNLRRDGPKTFAADAALIKNKSASSVNHAGMAPLRGWLLRHANVTQRQVDALYDAYKKQIPYLSPENTIPPGTSVKSLLAQKTAGSSETSYGRISVRNQHVEQFEKFQNQLAGIHAENACRQLYQAMHGHQPLTVLFSEKGVSACIPSKTGNTVHVNTRFAIIDPISGTKTPLCVILGHELEHANAPGKFMRSTVLRKSSGPWNVEELRVIDGYENGMHSARGVANRSTHMSHYVPIDPTDESIAFSYRTMDDKEHFLRPGDTLVGKIKCVDEDYIAIERADGSSVRLATHSLFNSIFGGAQLLRLGFKDPRSGLETLSDRYSTLYKLIEGAKSGKFRISDPATDQFALLDASQRLAFEGSAQMERWRAAADRGDAVELSVNPQGIINLKRHANIADPIGELFMKRRQLQMGNERNRFIATMIVLGTAGLTLASVAASKNRTKRPGQNSTSQST